jgi:predicted nucleic acid-binding protein
VIVVDTTVLVYAVGADHPLRDPCRALVEAVRAGEIRATTTVEVIQEFTHVRARRRSRRDAADLARAYVSLFAPLLPIDVEDLHGGLELFEEHDALGPFDAVLASATLRRSAQALVSADAAFAQVRELDHLDPAAADFLDALAAGQ